MAYKQRFILVIPVITMLVFLLVFGIAERSDIIFDYANNFSSSLKDMYWLYAGFAISIIISIFTVKPIVQRSNKIVYMVIIIATCAFFVLCGYLLVTKGVMDVNALFNPSSYSEY